MSSASPDLELVRAVVDDLPVGVWVARAPTGELLYANRTFAEIMGMGARDDVAVGEYSEPYGIRRPDGSPYPEEEMPFVRALRANVPVVVDDIVIHRRDGRRVNVRAWARPVPGPDGEPSHIIIAFVDVTREMEAERRRVELEARLRRAEKLEAIGRLAGGVAHDLNNVLAAISVLVDGVRGRLGGDPTLEHLDAAVSSGAALARQLLRFGIADAPRSSPVSLADVARGVGGLLDRTLGERFAVRLEVASDASIDGDRSQLEQVVMNLALNARDAMPDGGTIRLRVLERQPDEETAARLALALRPHVLLEVVDSGAGIPPELRTRVFEPFFSTRAGSDHAVRGLGLATVEAIVTRHAGVVTIDDAVPRGTVVRVWLPGAAHSEAGAPDAFDPAI